MARLKSEDPAPLPLVRVLHQGGECTGPLCAMCAVACESNYFQIIGQKRNEKEKEQNTRRSGRMELKGLLPSHPED